MCLGNLLGEASRSRASMACRAGGERPGRCRAGVLGVFKVPDETVRWVPTRTPGCGPSQQGRPWLGFLGLREAPGRWLKQGHDLV